MFLGTYNHSVDKKNRIILPAKIVSSLSINVVISKGFDGCLELRPLSEFEKYSTKLMGLSQNKKESRIVVRQLLANAASLEIDKINRILIPQNLLDECLIKHEVTIIGVGNKLELWDKTKYEEFKTMTDSTYEAIAEKLGKEDNE